MVVSCPFVKYYGMGKISIANFYSFLIYKYKIFLHILNQRHLLDISGKMAADSRSNYVEIVI